MKIKTAQDKGLPANPRFSQEDQEYVVEAAVRAC